MRPDATTMLGERLWGIGQMANAGGPPVAYPVTDADIRRDAVWAGRQLGRFGIPRGTFVMLISMGWETAHIRPFEIAAETLALPTCDVGPDEFDAPRLAGVLGSLNVGLLVGVSAGIVRGLDQAGHAPESILGGRTILARPEAELPPDLAAHAWFLLGPAVAIECPARQGAHVNGQEWAVASTPDGLTVTGLVGSRRSLVGVETGREGEVLTRRCACGSGDPRVVLHGRTIRPTAGEPMGGEPTGGEPTGGERTGGEA